MAPPPLGIPRQPFSGGGRTGQESSTQEGPVVQKKVSPSQPLPGREQTAAEPPPGSGQRHGEKGPDPPVPVLGNLLSLLCELRAAHFKADGPLASPSRNCHKKATEKHLYLITAG